MESLRDCFGKIFMACGRAGFLLAENVQKRKINVSTDGFSHGVPQFFIWGQWTIYFVFVTCRENEPQRKNDILKPAWN